MNDTRKIKSRFKAVAKAKGVHINRLEVALGRNINFLSNATRVYTDDLIKLNELYPDVSLDWILTEEGSLIKGEPTPQPIKKVPADRQPIHDPKLVRQLTDATEELITLRKKNDRLLSIITSFIKNETLKIYVHNQLG